jgi:uroporphyrinogen decarboxylase
MSTEPVLHKPAHGRLIDSLLAESRAHGGLAPVDLDRFWADQARAIAAPFCRDIPQCPLGMMMSGECVYDELGIPEDFWRYNHDEAWRLSLNKAYNDKSEQIVGRRLLNEKPGPPPENQWPAFKPLHEVFEAKNIWHSGSWWLEQSARTPDELKALLDRVEARLPAMRDFLLPPEWHAAKPRLQALGVPSPLYRGQRGPVTFATSIFGLENLMFLLIDEPDLAERFRNAIRDSMLAIARVLDEEAGFTPETAPHGFSFFDDNCYLLTPDMYEFFGYPVLEALFRRYSPTPGDRRYQHSDSAMGHLLPLFSRLNMTGVNFGPTVPAADIRRHLPGAIIEGQMAPFTLSRNNEPQIVAEFLRDFDMTRDSRGLRFTTAGSINNGSRLTSMRLIMAAIQRYGRYEK